MSTPNRIPTEGYSSTDDATAIEVKTRNNRSINHNNRRRRQNQTGNRSLASFTGEVPSVGAVLGTVSEHRIIKDQFNKFQDKLKEYLICKFDNPREIIIVIQYLKDPYVHVDT